MQLPGKHALLLTTSDIVDKVTDIKYWKESETLDEQRKSFQILNLPSDSTLPTHVFRFFVFFFSKLEHPRVQFVPPQKWGFRHSSRVSLGKPL